MAEQLQAGMPMSLDLGAGYTLRVTALDTSGAVDTGVNIDTLVLTVEDLTGQGGANLVYGDWRLVIGQAG